MQYEPTADELLTAIAEVLDEQLLPALPDELKHTCRVAANLARIVEREQRFGPGAATRERAHLLALLDAGPDGGGTDERGGPGPVDRGADEDTIELSRRLVQRIAIDDDPQFQRRAWEALVAIARDDVTIAKPGHAAWEGP